MNEQAFSLTGMMTLALRRVVLENKCVEGVDVYGSFLIGITLKDSNGNAMLGKQAQELARFTESRIYNKYIAKVKPGKHSMVIPLGAKAELTPDDAVLAQLPKGNYTLVLTDITGTTWEQVVTK